MLEGKASAGRQFSEVPTGRPGGRGTVASAEEDRVDQEWLNLPEFDPLSEVGLERKLFLVCRQEAVRRRSEEGQHGQIHFTMSSMRGRVYQAGPPAFSDQQVAGPEIAVGQGRGFSHPCDLIDPRAQSCYLAGGFSVDSTDVDRLPDQAFEPRRVTGAETAPGIRLNAAAEIHRTHVQTPVRCSFWQLAVPGRLDSVDSRKTSSELLFAIGVQAATGLDPFEHQGGDRLLDYTEYSRHQNRPGFSQPAKTSGFHLKFLERGIGPAFQKYLAIVGEGQLPGRVYVTAGAGLGFG